MDIDDLAKCLQGLSNFSNPKSWLFYRLMMSQLAVHTCWNPLIKFIPEINNLVTSWARKDEMFGLGNVWSHSFSSPSAPTEANTFYDDGCHWTWLQFFICAGKVKIIFAFSVLPMCTVPSIHPATNRGELYEHSTEWTSALSGIVQTLFFPIYQKDTSEFPDPMSKNLSLSSNQEISKIAS